MSFDFKKFVLPWKKHVKSFWCIHQWWTRHAEDKCPRQKMWALTLIYSFQNWRFLGALLSCLRCLHFTENYWLEKKIRTLSKINLTWFKVFYRRICYEKRPRQLKLLLLEFLKMRQTSKATQLLCLLGHDHCEFGFWT